MRKAKTYVPMNFQIEEIEFDERSPYTLKLIGWLSQSRMVSYLRGSNLEIERPLVLSEKQRRFVEEALLKRFSSDFKTVEEVETYKEKCPFQIHISGK